MQLLSIMNQKGGVGKTTTAVTLAAEAAIRGLDVLLIDADPQGSATEQLFPGGAPELGLSDLLTGGASWREATATAREPGALGPTSGRLDVMAGDDGLMLVEAQLNEDPNPKRLQRFVRKIRNAGAYDLVLIDGAPGVGLLVVNVIVAADVVLCPVSLSSMSIRGVQRLRALVGQAESVIDVAPRVLYLPTMADARLSETDELLEALGGFGHFPDGDLLPAIRSSAGLSRAFGLGLVIQDHNRRDRAAQDYAAIYDLLSSAGIVPAADGEVSTSVHPA